MFEEFGTRNDPLYARARELVISTQKNDHQTGSAAPAYWLQPRRRADCGHGG